MLGWGGLGEKLGQRPTASVLKSAHEHAILKCAKQELRQVIAEFQPIAKMANLRDTTHPPVGFVWCDTRGKSRKKYFLYLFGVSINMQKNSYFLIFFENFRVILHTNAYYFFNFRALAKKKVASDLLRFGSQLLPSRFFVSWPETSVTEVAQGIKQDTHKNTRC